MTKKDDITTHTKAELIKALRASVAREAKLQKQVTALKVLVAKNGLAAADMAATHEPNAMREEWERKMFRELEPLYQEDSSMVGPDDEDQAPPAFPWEKD